MRSTLPVSSLSRTSRTSPDIGLLRLPAWRAGKWPMRSDRIVAPDVAIPPGEISRSRVGVSGVFFFRRVTIRQLAACNFAHQASS
jgi:hypothetical protein